MLSGFASWCWRLAISVFVRWNEDTCARTRIHAYSNSRSLLVNLTVIVIHCHFMCHVRTCMLKPTRTNTLTHRRNSKSSRRSRRICSFGSAQTALAKLACLPCLLRHTCRWQRSGLFCWSQAVLWIGLHSSCCGGPNCTAFLV